MDATVGRPASGTTLAGRYRLDARIGTGGSGEVWRATDEVLGRQVAVKVLREHVADDPAMRRMIEREARRAASLTAAGIPAIHDVGFHDDLPFLVMELVEGETLADRLRRERPLPTLVAVEIGAAAADAVDAVHRHGVVHRDVKPENLLLGDDGRVRLTDFGIAGRTDPDLTMTEHSSSLGTVQYVSPERAQGAAPAAASDIYALGVVVYELLAGRRPFEGEPAAVLLAHVSSPPPPLPDTVPAGVSAAVMRALRKDPAQRQTTAAELAQELRAGVSGTTAYPAGFAAAVAPTAVLPSPVSGSERAPAFPPPTRPRQSRAWAIAVFAVLAVIVIASIVAAQGAPGIGPAPGEVPITEPVPVDTAAPVEPAPVVVEPAPVEPAPVEPAPAPDDGGNGRGRDKKDR